MDYKLSTSQEKLIKIYINQLKEWNEKMNLVSRNINFELSNFDMINYVLRNSQSSNENFSSIFVSSIEEDERIENLDDIKSLPITKICNKENCAAYDLMSYKEEHRTLLTSLMIDTKSIEYQISNSIQIARFIEPNQIVGDIGSGNGLPGILLGILGIKVILIESSTKKCKFLEHVSSLLMLEDPNISIKVINKPAQECKSIKFDILVSRAFSGGVTLLNAIKSLDHKKLITLKSKNINIADIKQELKISKTKYKIKLFSGFGSNIVVFIR